MIGAAWIRVLALVVPLVFIGVPRPGMALPATGPDWIAESQQIDDWFGSSVASAGDVNGDGYDDVVVGAPYHEHQVINEGQASLFLGSASGLSTTPAWTAWGGQRYASFGVSVASAGDVNGDGYADVIVGADGYDQNVANEGKAFLYLGSASGLTVDADWTATGGSPTAQFGFSVASAGDVNGDGFDDVLVGANGFDGGQRDEGRALLYLGSGSGLSATPDWTARGHQVGATFGFSVASAGDVNGDGFDDVVVGAPNHDQGQRDDGEAFLFLGSALGLSASSDWDARGHQAGADFGFSVASAGDVNGDGYGDAVVGAFAYDQTRTDEGKAFLFLGSATGLSDIPDWTARGNQVGAWFGVSVAGAGDVNGDGYDDLVVGASQYDRGQTDEGGAFLFLGSASGPSSAPDWSATGHQLGARLGSSVASAGDVDGDGHDDVIAGNVAANRQRNEWSRRLVRPLAVTPGP